MSAWPVELSTGHARSRRLRRFGEAAFPRRGAAPSRYGLLTRSEFIQMFSNGQSASASSRAVGRPDVHPVVQTEEVGRVDVGEPLVPVVDALAPEHGDEYRVRHELVVELATNLVPLVRLRGQRLVQEPVDLRVVEVDVVAVTARRVVRLAVGEREPEPVGGRVVGTPAGISKAKLVLDDAGGDT